jgi:cell division septation protein DedD
MSDEGFHEIQLNGKQLIFLFMAAAVVGVVVFLSGVMVGRGVRAEKGAAALGDTMSLTPETTPAGGAAAPATPPPTPPPPVNDELSYYNRLEGRAAPAENPKTPPVQPQAQPRAQPAEKTAVPPAEPARLSKPVADKADTTKKPEPASARASQAGTTGFSVQVIALKERAASEAIARRLAAKGYNAYVLDPAPGSRSTIYRVRVGPYQTRREADDAKRRLEKEEQFKPSITR